MSHLEQLRSVTRSYPSLQGLRMIPFGLFILSLAPQNIENNWLGGQGNCPITLPMLFAAALLWFVIGRYYERTFGKVELGSHAGRQWIEGVAALALIVGVIVLENVLYRARVAPPISLIGLALASLYLLLGVRDHRWYYVLAAIVLIAVSFLPLITGTTVGNRLYGTFGFVFSGAYGLIVLVTGVLDHFTLIRGLHAAQEAAHGRNA